MGGTWRAARSGVTECRRESLFGGLRHQQLFNLLPKPRCLSKKGRFAFAEKVEE
jgi:hypothetical protein